MYVVDIETAGPNGIKNAGLNGICARDKIVEVGVVQLTPEGIEDVYSAVVNHPDIEGYSDSWVFQNTDLTVEMVKDPTLSTPQSKVIKDLNYILDGKPATSFNTYFDFDLFLSWWVMPIVPFDIMELAGNIINRSDAVKSEYAYNYFFPEDGPGLGSKQTHRALDDARREAYILLALLGLYPTDGGE